MSRLTDEKEFMKELSSLEQLYSDVTGQSMAKFYRPPEGRFSEENLKWLKRNGYKTVFWSIAYADWDNENQPSCDFAKRKILDYLHNGAIILLHPTSATNVTILRDLIQTIKSEGYRFGTLNELTA
jgi:peptidoglycan-N-acetylmuramic acid deacetylase